MASISSNYTTAMRNFTALTSKAAPTLKNKGQEAGLKKLLTVMKSGKTLEQRIQEYEAAAAAVSACKDDNLAALPGLMKKLNAAVTDMNAGLKKNMDEYDAHARVLGGADADMKAGFEILSQRLDALRKYAKTDLLQVAAGVENRLGKKSSTQDVLNKNLKMVHLGLKKGTAEFEAALKQFLAKPTKQNLQDALCSGVQARSISVAVTHWKSTVLKTAPGLADKLTADPLHLLKHINDPAQNKAFPFWEAKFDLDKAGWEDRAKVQVKKYLDQTKHWRTLADQIKGLIQ